MFRPLLSALMAALLFVSAPTAFAKDYADVIEGLQRLEGLMAVFIDEKAARVLLELPAADDEGRMGRFVHAAYLTGGLGSNPVGLDRSVPTGGRIVHFRRAGKRVMLVVENQRFRASADNAAERRAVQTSFAQSVLWSGEVKAEAPGGGVLIDISSLLTSDVVGVAARLKARKQGSFSVDGKRSYVHTEAAFAFPTNLEFDATLTFKGSNPGPEVRGTTPVPEAVSLIGHHSFLALPDDGYTPRRYEARAAMIPSVHIDMSAPLDGDVVVRLARRFRLELGPDGKVVKPIVFYVDNGAPEPIRSALVEGASWWASAFEAAGFPGGYRVEVLPEGAHPLDARYNVINWVHRATRGWSYGASVADPRTGEVLRGVVLLGSLRVRQDIKIFEALAGAGKTGTGEADDPVQVALARLRQLSAHEVGHTLGFAHNMAASTYGGRGSVMDYPAPLVRLDGDRVDFSKAYAVGMGAWDDFTVDMLYRDYQGKDDLSVQTAMMGDADAVGLVFVSDGDSRAVDTGHVKGALWDNGANPLDELTEVMALRRHALDRFGNGNLRSGEPATALQTKFVPLYLYHRYQLQAVAKAIGGVDFAYRGEGDGRAAPVPVAVDVQRASVQALASTLAADVLQISAPVLAALSPTGQAEGDPQFRRESFKGMTRPMFDEVAAVEAAAAVTINAVLAPARLARLAQQGALDRQHPGLGLLDAFDDQITRRSARDGARAVRIGDIVESVYVGKLLSLAADTRVSVDVAAWVDGRLEDLSVDLNRRRGKFAPAAKLLLRRITDARERFGRKGAPAIPAPSVPPGSPIGSLGMTETCWHGC